MAWSRIDGGGGPVYTQFDVVGIIAFHDTILNFIGKRLSRVCVCECCV